MKFGKKKINYFILAFFAFLIAVAMIIYPENAFDASVRGLNVWWNIVFPALLPFFIAAGVMTGLGVVHFVGVMLEPMMRPLFRVPGVGAFVMAVGLASGFPIGAMLSADYRERNDLSKEEGERLMSFTNTADPLFMSGAVAVGMLGWPQIGLILVIAHYLSSLSTGLLMRFYKAKAAPSEPQDKGKDFILYRAARALVRARRQDNRPIAKLMGDSIAKAINSLLIIGGFIISFSVIIEMVIASGLLDSLASLLHVQAQSLMLLANGAMEITLGCQNAAQSSLPMAGKIIAMSAIIAWSGLSVHGQVASFISKTDMSVKPFVFARLIHASLAGLYTAIMFSLDFQPPLPAFAIDYVSLNLGAKYWFSTASMFKVLGLWAGAGLVCSMVTTVWKIKIRTFKVN